MINKYGDLRGVVEELDRRNQSPDYLFVFFPETIELPEGIHACPCPIIAFVCEANIRYQIIRAYCDLFDLIIADIILNMNPRLTETLMCFL